MIIPKQRECAPDFLEIMKSLDFEWELEELNGD